MSLPKPSSRLFTLALLLALPAPGRAQFETSQHYSEEAQMQVIEAVVRISLGNGNTGVQGSGICIGCDGKYSYILTCAHVLEHAEQATFTRIETFSMQHYPNASGAYTGGVHFWRNERDDLGLIKAPMIVSRSVKLCPANHELRFGIPVLAVGCGRGAPPVCQVGTFARQDGRHDFVMNRGGVPGRSGGALLCGAGIIGVICRGGNEMTSAANLWKIHRFLGEVGPAALKTELPAPAAPPTDVAVLVGEEDLNGYGKLAFRLYKDGRAEMIDKDGTTAGTWTVEQQQLRLTFYNGQVVYSGSAQGETISGTARNGNRTWSWAVRLQR